MKEKQIPSLALALSTLAAIFVILIGGMMIIKVEIHVLLIGCILIAGGVAAKLGYTYDDIVGFMNGNVSRGMGALWIFIMIGPVISSWMSAGTIPALIYYGLDIISPRFFLVTGLILCSLMSMATGTSWGTIGSLGIAFMGIGGALGIPLPIVAGMVISGALFGDKMSPVSDTTNLAPMAAESELYAHIKAMWLTTVPTYALCIIIYTIIGFNYGADTVDTSSVANIQSILREHFNLNLITLLPIVVVLVLSFAKKPALLAMTAGVITASIISLTLQGNATYDVLNVINNGFSLDTGDKIVNKLLNRGGIMGMMWTFSMSVMILAMGGILDKSGHLPQIVNIITAKIQRAGSMVLATILTIIGFLGATGDSYTAIIIPGNLFAKAYDRLGLARNMLSRVLEEGSTLLCGMLPWTVSAIYYSSTLGVPTLEYLPYTFLAWINPILSITLAYMGIFVIKNTDKIAYPRFEKNQETTNAKTFGETV